MNIEKEYALLNKLYFERISGTESELKACRIIADDLKEIGLESHIESFDVVRNTVQKVTFEVTEPYHKVYEASVYMGCVNAELLSAELAYFESDTAVSRKNVEGKIALVSGGVNMKKFKALCEAHALGFITFNGDIDQPENDLDPKELRPAFQEFGNLPGINIRVHDAVELVEKQASRVNIVLEQTMCEEKSHNLICDIRGESDDWIVCTAHYDSVPNSKGIYDNATGAVCLYGMAEDLKDKKLKHNVRFVWCGSEERGLLGSKAYVRDHKDELEQIKLAVNIDMIGCIIGNRSAVSTADQSLVHYVDYYSKMVGYPLESSQGVYPSDSTPFADAGVPAVTFARNSAGTAKIHSRFDIMEHLSRRILGEDTEFILHFVETIANAYIIPVVREMPDNMKEELDKYFGRDLLKKQPQDTDK